MAFNFSSCKGQTTTYDEPIKDAVFINANGANIEARFPVPEGFERVKVNQGSFAEFLRKFSLLPNGSKVKFHTGELKPNQSIHKAVLDIDVGQRNLQQCADAVIRLHAEYLYSSKRYNEIAYNFISDGNPRYFSNYNNGETDYTSFRKYLDYIFSYANTRSLYHQLEKVDNFKELFIGDVLIQTGNPYGHAVLIVDMAENPGTGEKIYMLAQSYMPAQSIHVLVNPESNGDSPWYSAQTKDKIITPEWTFYPHDLRRFPKQRKHL